MPPLPSYEPPIITGPLVPPYRVTSDGIRTMKRFLVSCEEIHGDHRDGKIVYADDHRNAAEKWADYEDRHSADYWIIGGETAEVRVTELGDDDKPTGKPLTLFVDGESVPVYRARPKK